MFKVRLVVVVLVVAVFLAACGGEKSVQVSNIWARPGLAGGNSAVYFVIDNSTAGEDVLLSASSDVAQAVELHMSMMEGDAMQMKMQQYVPIPAGKTEFKPGGLHVMLIGLNSDLNIGDSFTVILNFETAGEQALTVMVKEQ